jgi:hypothetical protein
VKIEWSPAARASARRYMADQDGMRAIGTVIDGDLITVERVDRLAGG